MSLCIRGASSARRAPGGTAEGPFAQDRAGRDKGFRAELVSVALQLFDHAEAENRLFASVVEDVDADQTRVDLAPNRFGKAVMRIIIVFRHRKTIAIVEKEGARVNDIYFTVIV